VDGYKAAVSDEEDDDEAIEQHLQSILEDEIDEYNAVKDNALLDKAGKGKRRGRARQDEGEEEEEIYPLDLTSSDEEEDGGRRHSKKKPLPTGLESGDEEDEELKMSDEDEDDDDDGDLFGTKESQLGIPDSRAWGKKARIFHNTDYIDQDFGGFEGSDAEMAEQEELEAKEIQKRLTAELEENDFLSLIPVVKKPQKSSGSKEAKSKEILKIDFDNLSIGEKKKLIERECPEVVHMLDEYKDKLKDARNIRQTLEEVEAADAILHQFYQSKFHAILNYCINISYYLYLRATSPTNCKGHPVIKRILQFRRLLDELSKFDPSKYVRPEGKPEADSKEPRPKKKKVERDVPLSAGDSNPAPDVQFQFGDESDDNEDVLQEKRGITYAIAKNKGLTPRRKKEQRNPRVKHREKYRKAKIRRKGQVRTVRTEMQRYGGEATGIKSHLTKSVKLK